MPMQNLSASPPRLSQHAPLLSLGEGEVVWLSNNTGLGQVWRAGGGFV